MDVRRLKTSSTVSELTAIEDRRRKLEKRIRSFKKKGDTYMGVVELDEAVFHDESSDWNGIDEWDEDEDTVSDRDGGMNIDGLDDVEREQPERLLLCLPSTLGKVRLAELGLGVLASQEMELRKGQANDALAGLRIELGHKALLFRTKVRHSSNTKGKTRAWNEIRVSSREVMKQVRLYRHAKKTLEDLGADEVVLNKYRNIEKGDLKMSADMLEENRFGQRNDSLAWFWRLGPQDDSVGDGWMEECE
jgi:hypothetical protein